MTHKTVQDLFQALYPKDRRMPVVVRTPHGDYLLDTMQPVTIDRANLPATDRGVDAIPPLVETVVVIHCREWK